MQCDTTHINIYKYPKALYMCACICTFICKYMKLIMHMNYSLHIHSYHMYMYHAYTQLATIHDSLCLAGLLRIKLRYVKKGLNHAFEI